MLTKLKLFIERVYKYHIYQSMRYAIDLMLISFQKLVYKSQTSLPYSKPLRAVIVTDDLGYTSQTQFDPFFVYRRVLRQRFGFVFNKMHLETALHHPKGLSKFDVIFVKIFFTTPAAQVQSMIEHLHAAKKSSAKLVYFDGDDDLCIQWPGIFPYLDLYVKKHIFYDLEQYGKIFLGKNNLSHYISSQWGVSMPTQTQPLPVEQRGKIFLGYNVGVDNKIRNFAFTRSVLTPSIRKENDIVCRVSVDLKTRYFYLRQDAVSKLQAMSSKYRVICSTHNVSQQEYYYEMFKSKICVSPFGYGEICWRDFEAILCRCLLIKPDMSHARTSPDIFQPYESYIPVKWDFSDLEEQCIYYLEHDSEREKIIQRAYQILTNYYRYDGFLDQFTEMLSQVGWTQLPAKDTPELAPERVV